VGIRQSPRCLAGELNGLSQTSDGRLLFYLFADVSQKLERKVIERFNAVLSDGSMLPDAEERAPGLAEASDAETTRPHVLG